MRIETRKVSRARLAAATGLLLATGLFAAEKREESWNRRIGETVTALKANEAAKALATIEPVLDEMSRKANPGKSANKGIGMGLMLRALANAARGDERSAAWDWQLAQQIEPSLEGWDLAEFGEAGAELDRHRLARDPVPEVSDLDAIVRAGGRRPEVLRRGSQPAYLQRARERGWQGEIRISTVVDAAGVPTHPRISGDTADAGIVLATAEFVRAIEFRPAELEGKPIASEYVLVNSYKLSR
jgi:hypothetical protein